MLSVSLPNRIAIAMNYLCSGLLACVVLCNSARSELPPDSRLGELRTLDGYFPFHVPESLEAWEKRAEEVRMRMRVSLGLWPEPTRSPLDAVVHGAVDRGDYTVERVYFESRPGFFVTGSLYRPTKGEGPFPAVLSPHGHWANGRFMDAGEEEARKEIEAGAEEFLENARSPLQARCATLARMGCIVFHFDMIGYADSQQISYDLAHRFAKLRPEMNTAKDWGLFSSRAESNLQSVLGLQVWNAIRAMDFLESLPDVDADRIAVTGASGGGTQTFMLSAIDPRVAVSFPAVMVSTAMQGGCTCENVSLVRIDSGNVEFAGLFAPKPLGMTAADDWTVDMPTKGFPELKRLFHMHGADDHVSLAALTQFGHNYNARSRHAMYQWMNEHLKLGLDSPVVERPIERLTTDEMTVWNDEHPRPESGDDFERRLLREMYEGSRMQIRELATDPERFRDVVGSALKALIGRDLESAGDSGWEMISKIQRDGFIEMRGLIRNQTHREALPAVAFHPAEWNENTVIWVNPGGKGSALDGDAPVEEIRRMLAKGDAVVAIDLFQQGDFLEDEEAAVQNRLVDNGREAACYTYGYNHSIFGRRVHDILTAIRFTVEHPVRKSKSITLIARDGAGKWAIPALALSGDSVKSASVDTAGFRFQDVDDIRHEDFLPGGAKYGDLPGFLTLSTTTRISMTGESSESLWEFRR